jgi:hypothetical protein
VEGGDEAWPASSASLRLLFFDAPNFELFAEDVFILQVTGFFTRIRLGAIPVANCGGARV